MTVKNNRDKWYQGICKLKSQDRSDQIIIETNNDQKTKDGHKVQYSKLKPEQNNYTIKFQLPITMDNDYYYLKKVYAPYLIDNIVNETSQHTTCIIEY